MAFKRFVKYLILMTIAMICSDSFAQNNVPLGIHYQAVARDNFGNELVNRKISVKFSIISGNPEGPVVYQEVHQDIITSKFGVFSIIIGHGIPTGDTPFGELSQIEWDKAFHYLKVEVKFENTYMDMGTMQFLAVPYALYAQRSLEPGPAGPKGDPGPKGEAGDPATDDQTLSVINIDGSDYLSISGGNGVKISSIERDGDPTNEIQDLVINSNKLKITKNTGATEWDLTKYLDNTDNQSITYDAASRVLGISGNALTINLSELKDDADADPVNEIQDLVYDNAKKELRITKSTAPVIDLSDLKNDADADPVNEIQDLQLAGNILKVTGKSDATSINLAPYLDNTDNQSLTYDAASRVLGISGNALTINLSELKNDADADPTNEIQDLQLAGNILKVTGKSDATSINLAPYLDNTDNQGLTYSESTKTLSIDRGTGVVLGSMVAFRAKNTSTDIASIASYPVMTYDAVDYNVGNYLNAATGIFTAPVDGIYTFNVSFYADGVGDGREISIYLNSVLYEKLAISIGAGTIIPVRSVTMRLSATNTVSIVVYTGLATQTGTGSFSGYKVY